MSGERQQNPPHLVRVDVAHVLDLKRKGRRRTTVSPNKQTFWKVTASNSCRTWCSVALPTFFNVTVVVKNKSSTPKLVIFDTLRFSNVRTHTMDKTPSEDVSSTESAGYAVCPTRPLLMNVCTSAPGLPLYSTVNLQQWRPGAGWE